jgi:citronellol/citronellal dehydrogenase
VPGSAHSKRLTGEIEHGGDDDAVELLDLIGQVAIVTGGGSGIGAAIAKTLAQHRADLVLAGRHLDTLEENASTIREQTGRRVETIVTDVKREDDCIALVRQTVECFGRLDILVNNAGGARGGPLVSYPTAAWDSVMNLNLRGPFILSREAGRHMIGQRSGCVVNVSSVAGQRGAQGQGPYSAAKAGLQMLTAVTAAEWGPHGVRANCVAVGAVASSDRTVAHWEVIGLERQAMGASTSIGRIGTASEIAAIVLFLSSRAASYVNGQTFAADGGPRLPGRSDEKLTEQA